MKIVYQLIKTRITETMHLILILLVFNVTLSCKTEKKRAEKGDGEFVPKNDFRPLFNGKNWEGWYLKLRNGDSLMAEKVYAIEDGMVHVFKDIPDSLDLNTGENNTHGLFYNKETFDRFIIRFEYKWGDKIANNFEQFQYDAGLYYHVYDDAIWPKGLEYQVRYDHTEDQNHTGDFWATNVRINKWFADDEGAYLPESEGGTLQEPKIREHRAKSGVRFNGLNNKWNHCEAIVMGDQYAIHKLNGEVVNVGTDLTHGQGILGFQSETAEIYYRNIEIMELDGFVPMEKFLE